jgi:hypothetical protein
MPTFFKNLYYSTRLTAGASLCAERLGNHPEGIETPGIS